ncbi:MAG: hypothetical protein KGO96_08670 [Elusimicrobia bacterium]|nr:hypothetical protein [Elusimicrobiota bacterium]MDE2425962.1 hypothetical protein [Elusimicrobiota bacterium]
MRKSILPVLLGFLLGAAAMLALPRLRHRRHAPDPARLAQRFSRELGLSDPQRLSVQAALEASAGRLRSLREETAAKFKAIRAQTRSDIRAMLTPEQQKRFDEMARRWDSRRRR